MMDTATFQLYCLSIDTKSSDSISSDGSYAKQYGFFISRILFTCFKVGTIYTKVCGSNLNFIQIGMV